MQRRYEGDHGLRDARGDREEIRVGERRQIGQAVDPAADPFEDAGVAKGIQIARMDAGAEGLRRAEDASGATEDTAYSRVLLALTHDG